MTISYHRRFLSTEERFWDYVKKSLFGCWEWKAGKDAGGYGHFFLKSLGKGKKKHTKAHRFSWELHYGPIPDGLFVCHKCDNPACVRPTHLFLGDNSTNIKDAFNKGRMTRRGIKNSRAKTTETEVIKIRKTNQLKGESQAALARRIAPRYNLSVIQVQKILGRRAWTHI